MLMPLTSGMGTWAKDFQVLKLYMSVPLSPSQEMGFTEWSTCSSRPLGPEQVWGGQREDTELCVQSGSGLICGQGQASVSGQAGLGAGSELCL